MRPTRRDCAARSRTAFSARGATPPATRSFVSARQACRAASDIGGMPGRDPSGSPPTRPPALKLPQWGATTRRRTAIRRQMRRRGVRSGRAPRRIGALWQTVRTAGTRSPTFRPRLQRSKPRLHSARNATPDAGSTPSAIFALPTGSRRSGSPDMSLRIEFLRTSTFISTLPTRRRRPAARSPHACRSSCPPPGGHDVTQTPSCLAAVSGINPGMPGPPPHGPFLPPCVDRSR
jgi:hypothetical protein